MSIYEELKKHHNLLDIRSANIHQLMSVASLWDNTNVKKDSKSFTDMLSRCFASNKFNVTYVYKNGKASSSVGCCLPDMYEHEEVAYLREVMRAAQSRWSELCAHDVD